MTLRPIELLYPESVSVPDAARRSGLTYRQVSYWIAVKAVRPFFGTGGSGFPYRFTEEQVMNLIQVGDLYRTFEEAGLVPPPTEFIGRVWEALETTGVFNLVDGPLAIRLPWPSVAERLGA